ncbi:cold shock domain-containing protein [Rhodoferax saidenbachensis]|uniref:Cold-shock protein n=1 Tax=Rhodoferax saidenbachensis TaxID=1484693 RepID=A0A1P8KC73_9BURK|nr:cold shock domain-containing protein [Rhodoferax saidenbachensis]APW43601.1 cold-shock protein [Rhodoferax saidenbachensis]
MSQARYTGKLKKWNPERGFGFVVADDGGQDIFVHITAFPRDGLQPAEGESLSFEVEPDRSGKRSAVRVHRPGSSPHEPAHRPKLATGRSARTSDKSSFASTLISLALIVAVGWFAYSRYANRVVQTEAAAQAVKPPTSAPAPVSLFESPQPAPASFTCDGRKYCSQMTSCEEAKRFLKNCPGMEMDGDNDGIPCEQQLCTGG